MIKLQHDVNFLLKKGEANMEEMLSKEQHLEKALLQLKKLTEKENRRSESHKNMLEGLSLQQMTETIAKYQSRISDLN